MKNIRKILVATDLSELSIAAMGYAKMFATKFKAKIYLVHVVDTAPVPGVPISELNYVAVSHEIEKDTIKEMDHIAARYFNKIERLKLVICEGTPHEELIRLVEREKIDLIVMATHGRTGLAHIIIGSVAQKVVEHSPVPVVIVKPKEMHTSLITEHSHQEQAKRT